MFAAIREYEHIDKSRYPTTIRNLLKCEQLNRVLANYEESPQFFEIVRPCLVWHLRKPMFMLADWRDQSGLVRPLDRLSIVLLWGPVAVSAAPREGLKSC